MSAWVAWKPAPCASFQGCRNAVSALQRYGSTTMRPRMLRRRRAASANEMAQARAGGHQHAWRRRVTSTSVVPRSGSSMMRPAAGTMPIAHEAHEAAGRGHLARPAAMSAGDQHHRGHLGELAGREGLTADEDPAPGAADDRAHAGHQHRHEPQQATDGDGQRQLAVPGVVEARQARA